MRRRAVLVEAFALLGVVIAGGGCNAGDPTVASTQLASCKTVDASLCQYPIPSYAKDVTPLLDRDCNRTCHAPDAGPWPLSDHQSVIDWTHLIVRDIEDCTMPPADAGMLTISERQMLLDWFACGAPNN